MSTMVLSNGIHKWFPLAKHANNWNWHFCGIKNWHLLTFSTNCKISAVQATNKRPTTPSLAPTKSTFLSHGNIHNACLGVANVRNDPPNLRWFCFKKKTLYQCQIPLWPWYIGIYKQIHSRETCYFSKVTSKYMFLVFQKVKVKHGICQTMGPSVSHCAVTICLEARRPQLIEHNLKQPVFSSSTIPTTRFLSTLVGISFQTIYPPCN